MISFICNICGQANTVSELRQEESSCRECGSNVRLRALIYLLSKELFGDAYILPDFPELPAIKGLGLSDQASYADRLALKFDYTNTYYDREPHLDITERHENRYKSVDFVLSSDVFEHIAPPVDRALDEVCKLLKPNGFLCMSVPFSLEESTRERFPDLHQFTLAELAGSPVLINRTRAGELQVFDELVFHGGVGATLEMRLFSQKDLAVKLTAAGFLSVAFLSEPVPRFGIALEGGFSLPMVARKQEFALSRQASAHLVRVYYLERLGHGEALTKAWECDRHIERLDAELARYAEWATAVQPELEQAKRELARIDAQFQERTKWALQLKEEAEAEAGAAAILRERLEAVAKSRWIRLGNRLGLGPKL